MATPEIRLFRSHLGTVFLAVVFAVLGGAHLAGAVGRGPLVAAGVTLLLALLSSALRAADAVRRRLLWRIRRKLILSYVFIAFVPLLLLLLVFALLGYVLTGQVLAYMAWRHLGELTREVDEACFRVADRLATEAQGYPDLATLRRGLEGATGLDADLAGLRARFEGLVTAAVVKGPSPGDPWVPPGLDEWPVGVKADRPPWLSESRFEAGFVLGASQTLEIRSASTARAGAFEVFVEVAVPLNETALQAIKRYIGMDLRVVEPEPLAGRLAVQARTTSGELGRPGTLATLPVFGVFFMNPTSWESGETLRGARLLVTQRSVRGLYDDLSRFLGREAHPENGALVVSLFVLVLGVFVLIEGTSLALGISLARSITGSIHDISEGTRRIERGELGHRFPVRTDDQLGDLGRSFNEMAAAVERRMRDSAERERLEEELRIGRRIQQSLLPREDWSHPRYEISAVSLPAKEVGGDYYDLLDCGEGRLGIVVADVSGKGTEAAFYMAEVKGIMLALSRLHPAPADVLTAANQLLAESLDRRTFVTMTYAVLDLEKRSVTFGRAGHSPVLLLRAVSGEVESLRPSGLALGLDRRGGFRQALEEAALTLRKDDLLLLYTDGVTDTMAEDGELYGESRLAIALLAARASNAEGIRDALVAELRRFAAAGPPHDDITIIVVRVRE